MSAEEMESFRASPHFEAAVQLRRWDEAAKVPEMIVPDLQAYVADMEQSLSGDANGVT